MVSERGAYTMWGSLVSGIRIALAYHVLINASAADSHSLADFSRPDITGACELPESRASETRIPLSLGIAQPLRLHLLSRTHSHYRPALLVSLFMDVYDTYAVE